MAAAVYLVTALQRYVTCIPSDARGHMQYTVHKYTHWEREKEINKQTKEQTNK
jgi:hypothetical protein